MTARMAIMLTAAVAVAAFVIGCGSSDEDDSRSVTTSSLSHTAFVDKAGAICVRGAEKALSYEPKPGTDPSRGEYFEAAVETSIAPALQQVINEIYDLGAPRGEEAEIEAFLEAMQEGVDSLEEQRTSISTFEQLEEPFHSPGKLAREYGLSECVYD